MTRSYFRDGTSFSNSSNQGDIAKKEPTQIESSVETVNFKDLLVIYEVRKSWLEWDWGNDIMHFFYNLHVHIFLLAYNIPK